MGSRASNAGREGTNESGPSVAGKGSIDYLVGCAEHEEYNT